MPQKTTNEVRLADARAELEKRLRANDGNNPCAEAFGGLKKALKALHETNFKFEDLGGPIGSSRGVGVYTARDAVTKGKTITINRQGRFYMDNFSLPFSNMEGRMLDMAKFSSGTPGNYVYATSDVQAASFILAHELGHRRKIYGKDDKDGGNPDRTARNNQKVWDACYKFRAQ